MMDSRSIATENLILKGVVGSTAHGLALDGADDRDEMGICLEPKEYVIGLRHFEQWTFRTQPDGVRSGYGDLDLVIYGFRKWARLAANGNPTILLLLYAPMLTISTSFGLAVRAAAVLFASRRAGRAFLGYLRAQRQRMTGERGGRHAKPRADLVEQFGYDTKYAMHLLRLGHQGVEFLETGGLTLPMPEPTRLHLMDVRQGKVSEQDVLTEGGELERRLEDLLDHSPLPPEPDWRAIDGLVISLYEQWWERRTPCQRW